MKPPPYFTEIHEKARQRWEQLEADPELAAPWHQLFRQVQSPPHVISELLQNADDAKATEVSIRLDGQYFELRHNGKDFTKSDFESICRFGYSNKRQLHTVGFRGIGFKSCFSLGNEILLRTPTLAVRFDHERFTLPAWSSDLGPVKRTTIEIYLKNQSLRKRVVASMNKWSKTPLSLLFFRNIESLTVDDTRIKKKKVRNGPVANSTVYDLSISGKSTEVILFRSPEEDFPEDCIEEIREERGAQDFDLPPCSIEVAYTGEDENALFCVLPTGINVEAPVAINAPFVQDPGRMAIKDPGASPTNEWLLSRAGEFLGDVFLKWISSSRFKADDRVRAYGLLPSPEAGDYEDAETKEACQEILIEALSDAVSQEAVILDEDGSCYPAATSRYWNHAVALAPAAYEIWSPEQLATMSESHTGLEVGEFDTTEKVVILHRAAISEALPTIEEWGWVKVQTKLEEYLDRCHTVPKPSSNQRLAKLWLILGERYPYSPRSSFGDLSVLPAAGNDEELRAENVLLHPNFEDERLSEGDRDMLERYFEFLDTELVEKLKRSIRGPKNDQKSLEGKQLDAFLKAAEISQSDTWEVVISSIGTAIERSDAEMSEIRSDMISAAHLACRLDVKLADEFPLITASGESRTALSGVIFDLSPEVEQILSEEILKDYLLHPDYEALLKESEITLWREWGCNQARSGITPFLRPEEVEDNCWVRGEMARQIASERGGGIIDNLYRSNDFRVTDFDFDEELWGIWQSRADDDLETWSRLLNMIVEAWQSSLEDVSSASIQQVSTNGHRKTASSGKLKARWLKRLSEKPCVLDRDGIPRLPSEVFWLDPTNAFLLDVEPFIDEKLQRPELEQFFERLGIRRKPDNIDALVDRLRQCCTERPVSKQLWRTLVRSLDRCTGLLSPEQKGILHDLFNQEALLLSESGSTGTAAEFYLSNPDALEGIDLVDAEARPLRLWSLVGVSSMPSTEAFLGLIQSLGPTERIPPGRTARVKYALTTIAAETPEKIDRWLNLGSKLVPIQSLKWMSLKGGVPNLFSAIAAQVADLSFLKDTDLIPDALEHLPRFDEMLQRSVEVYEPAKDVTRDLEEEYRWLKEIGTSLLRIAPPPAISEKHRAILQQERSIAMRLRSTTPKLFQEFSIVPEIDGETVGESSTPQVFWAGNLLYVDASVPCLVRELSEELENYFLYPEWKQALRDCVMRPPSVVRGYFEQYFDLVELEDLEEPAVPPDIPVIEPEEEDDSLSVIHIEDDSSQPDTSEDADVDPDETEDEEANSDEDNGWKKPNRRRRPQAPKQSAEHLYFETQGYEWRPQTGKFVGPNGNYIQHDGHEMFPWNETNTSDEGTSSYHFVWEDTEEGVVVGAHIWNFIRKFPENTLVIVMSEGRAFRPIDGNKAKKLKDAGELTIEPAAYRLSIVEKLVEATEKPNE